MLPPSRRTLLSATVSALVIAAMSATSPEAWAANFLSTVFGPATLNSGDTVTTTTAGLSSNGPAAAIQVNGNVSVTSSIGAHALNGGSIQFTPVSGQTATVQTTSTGLLSEGVGSNIGAMGLSVSTTGSNAPAVQAQTGGMISLQGGSINVSGPGQGAGVLAQNGGTVNLGLDAAGVGTQIEVNNAVSPGNGLYVISSNGAATSINATGVNLQVSGPAGAAGGGNGITLFGQGSSITLSNANVTAGNRGVYAWGTGTVSHFAGVQFQSGGILATGQAYGAGPAGSHLVFEDYVDPNTGAVRHSSITTPTVSASMGLLATTWLANSVLESSITATNMEVVTSGDAGNTGAVYNSGFYGSVGAFADVGGTITFTNGTITTSGQQSAGIEATDNSGGTIPGSHAGRITLLGNTRIVTQGLQSHGAVANLGGQIDMTGTHIETSGILAMGIHVTTRDDSNPTLNYTGSTRVSLTDGSILTTNSAAYGVLVSQAGASATLVRSTIHALLGNGIVTSSGGLANFSGTRSGSDIVVDGLNAVGVYGINGGLANVTQASIVAHGDTGFGSLSSFGSAVNVSNSDILVTGRDGFGAYSTGGNATTNISDTDILVTGDVQAFGGGIGASAAVTNISGGSIRVTGTGSPAGALRFQAGVLLFDGGFIQVDGTRIQVENDLGPGNGFLVLSQVSQTPLNVTNADVQVSGTPTGDWVGGNGLVLIGSGALATVSNSSIASSGHAIYALGTGTSSRFSGVELASDAGGVAAVGDFFANGLGSQLVFDDFEDPATGAIRHSSLTTRDPAAISTGLYVGARVVANENSITATNMEVTTAGSYGAYTGTYGSGNYGSVGVFADVGGTVTFTNGAVTTLGLHSAGLQATDSSAGGLAGSHAGRITVLGNTLISTRGALSHGAVASLGGSIDMTGTRIQTAGDDADGIHVSVSDADNPALISDLITRVQLTDGNITTSGASAAGVFVAEAGARATVVNSSVTTSGELAHGLELRRNGNIDFSNGAVTALGAGSQALRVAASELSVANLTNAQLTAQGSAIGVAGANATVHLESSQVSSPGAWLDVSGGSTSSVLAVSSQMTGAALLDDPGSLEVALKSNGSVSNLHMTGSIWNLTGTSTLTDLMLDSSQILFSVPGASGFKSLSVEGNYSANGSLIVLNTFLNAGGPLSGQATDRLLIEGDVQGTTAVRVVPAGGMGGLTGQGPGDGISLIQVGGNSSPDAFQLEGGYLAAGPIQYGLRAFGPGAADPGQNLLAGNLNWDYRLQNVDIGGRAALVPQIPAYLSAPHALFHFGQQNLDNLHRRLGELHDSQGLHPVPRTSKQPEIFVRGFGGQSDYSSDLGFRNFGYNFDQSYGGLQIGANFRVVDNQNGVFQLGVAGGYGGTSFSPRALDGRSSGSFDNYSFSGIATWQSRQGWYVDGVLSGSTFSGKISTDARGRAGKLTGMGFAASLEAGYPIDLGWQDLELEPQGQLLYQHLAFHDFSDIDNLTVNLGNQDQATLRLGARLKRSFQLDEESILTPYLRVNWVKNLSGSGSINVSNYNFNLGSYGSSLQYGGGITGTLSKDVSLYGELTGLSNLGGSGFSGWSATAGARVSF